MINNVMLENHRKKKNLSTALIDHKKTFDSIPHSWIMKCMNLYKVYSTEARFVQSSMGK